MSASTNQVAIRRRSFEKHVTECNICNAPVSDAPGGAKPVLCAAASIMLSHLMRELKAAQS